MVGHITLLQKFIFCPNFNFSQMPQPQQKKNSCLFTIFLAVCLRFISCLLTKLDFSNVPLKLNFCNSVDTVSHFTCRLASEESYVCFYLNFFFEGAKNVKPNLKLSIESINFVRLAFF